LGALSSGALYFLGALSSGALYFLGALSSGALYFLGALSSGALSSGTLYFMGTQIDTKSIPNLKWRTLINQAHSFKSPAFFQELKEEKSLPWWKVRINMLKTFAAHYGRSFAEITDFLKDLNYAATAIHPSKKIG